MKIISKGKPKECRRCGCIMEYNANDVKNRVINIITSDFLKTYERWSIDYIICPHCNNKIEVSQKCLK